jgi:outer membrane receptor protein involved in Fe transport
MKSPWATDPVPASFGVSERRDTLSFLPSYNLQVNDLIGQGQFFPPISGRSSVTDEYAEIRVPVMEAKPLVKSLNLDVAGRHSSYSIPTTNGFATNTFKIGADYAPTGDVRFRASYNRAIRAPNLYEMFFPNTEVPDTGYDDPCSGATPVASLAACEKTGVTAAQYGKIPGCLSAVHLDTNNSQPALNNGFYDAYDNVIPAYNYLDLSAFWQLGDHFTLRAGCNNVLDKDPPFLNDTVIYGVVGARIRTLTRFMTSWGGSSSSPPAYGYEASATGCADHARLRLSVNGQRRGAAGIDSTSTPPARWPRRARTAQRYRSRGR